MAKRILLTLSDGLYGALEKKQQEQGYSTVQELINEFVRRGLFGIPKLPVQPKSTKTGRPKKFSIEDIYTSDPPPGEKPRILWKGKPIGRK